MAQKYVPIKNQAYSFDIALTSQADTKLFQASPTLASGDVVIILDGVLLGNITSLPTVVTSTSLIRVSLTAAEMNADTVGVQFIDVAGAQWCSVLVEIFPETVALSGLSTLTAAQVWAYADRTLTSLSALVSSIAAAVWAYAARTLTQTAAQIAAAQGTTLAIHPGYAFTQTLTGVDVAGSPKLILTAKYRASDPDSAAVLQMNTVDGLTRLNGAAYATGAHGSLTIASDTSVTIALSVTATALLVGEVYGIVYDIKRVDTDVQVTKSTVNITYEPTQAVS